MVFRLITVLFLFSVGVFSQEKFIKHKISKGENLTVIAKKYGIKAKDIEDANPDSPKVLKLNSVLLIPNNHQKTATKQKELAAITTPAATTSNPVSPEVVEKETLWAISKKYNVSVDDLKKANPSLESEGLKIGQKLNIPSNAAVLIAATATNKITEIPLIISSEDVEYVVEVKPKETKYLIAKKYGITVAELERQNPFIKGKLPVGYVLNIKTSKEKADAAAASAPLQQINDNLSSAEETQVAETAEIKNTSAASIFKVNNHSELVDQLIVNATENIGTRYRSGGTTKAGFDCSGLMISTFNTFDIKLPRSSIEQSRIGMKVMSDEAQKGDLIFFKTNGRSQINHVGMVVEVAEGGEIKFVHSSTHGGVMISSTKEPYYQRAFSQVNRVLQ